MTGKTLCILKILKHHRQLFTTEYSKVLYCMPQGHLVTKPDLMAELRRAYPQIEIRGGVPTYADFRSSTLPKLVIIDDLYRHINTGLLEDVFTCDSHHYRLAYLQKKIFIYEMVYLTERLFNYGFVNFKSHPGKFLWQLSKKTGPLHE